MHKLEKSRQPDADGFITVSYKKTKSASVAPTTVTPKDYSLPDFYRHQTVHRRHEGLDSLRQRFEEDKLRLARLKEARRFRPY